MAGPLSQLNSRPAPTKGGPRTLEVHAIVVYAMQIKPTSRIRVGWAWGLDSATAGWLTTVLRTPPQCLSRVVSGPYVNSSCTTHCCTYSLLYSHSPSCAEIRTCKDHSALHCIVLYCTTQSHNTVSDTARPPQPSPVQPRTRTNLM